MNRPRKENARHANAAGIEGDQPGGQIENKDTPSEQPEHNGERRRFLCWAVMCGFAKPERLTERIVAEVESEAGHA